MKNNYYKVWRTLLHIHPDNPDEQEAIKVAREVVGKLLDGGIIIRRANYEKLMDIAFEIKCIAEEQDEARSNEV